MAVYSVTVTLANASYPTTPQVTIPFEPRSILIVDQDAALLAKVSFDGINDHGELIPGIVPSIKYDQHVTKVWLKSAGAPVVRIIAES